jgi:hypothetical protein
MDYSVLSKSAPVVYMVSGQKWTQLPRILPMLRPLAPLMAHHIAVKEQYFHKLWLIEWQGPQIPILAET